LGGVALAQDDYAQGYKDGTAAARDMRRISPELMGAGSMGVGLGACAVISLVSPPAGCVVGAVTAASGPVSYLAVPPRTWTQPMTTTTSAATRPAGKTPTGRPRGARAWAYVVVTYFSIGT
jgi:hypothetical protein